jgi:hypothetical protein
MVDVDRNQRMKKRGRPPIGGEIMTKWLGVRFTVDERAELDRAAGLSGLPTARWARNVILEAARKALGQAEPTQESK